METWKEIENFPGYQISDEGRVFSEKSNKLLTPVIRAETLYVTLCAVDGNFEKQIHVLVAEAFIPNPDALPMVNHKDSNRQNPRVSNLEWISARGNVYHSMTYGNYGNKPVKSVAANGSVCVYLSAAQAEKRTGIARSQIVAVCKGKGKTAGARQWYYISKEEYVKYENQ